MRNILILLFCGLSLFSFGQDSSKVKRRVEVYVNGGVSNLQIAANYIHPKTGYNFDLGFYYSITDRIDIGLNSNFSKFNYSSSILEGAVSGYLIDSILGPAEKNYQQVGTVTYKLAGDLEYFAFTPMLRFRILQRSKWNFFLSMNLFSIIRSSCTYEINTISTTNYPIEHTGNYVDYRFNLLQKSLNHNHQLINFSTQYKVKPGLTLFNVLSFDQSFSPLILNKGKLSSNGPANNTGFYKLGFNIGAAYNFNVKTNGDVFRKFDEAKKNKNLIYINRFGINYERKLFFIKQFCFSQSFGGYRDGSTYIHAKITALTLISYGEKIIVPQFGFYYYRDFYWNGFYHKSNGTDNFAATLGFNLNLSKHFFVRYSILPIKFAKFNYDVSRYQISQKMYYFNEHFASFGFSF